MEKILKAVICKIAVNTGIYPLFSGNSVITVNQSKAVGTLLSKSWLPPAPTKGGWSPLVRVPSPIRIIRQGKKPTREVLTFYNNLTRQRGHGAERIGT